MSRTLISRHGFLFIVVGAAVACGETIHVPGDYPTIQEGIDAAVDGDVVLVADGTYTGEGNRDLAFSGKAITLQSENGPETTVIDAEGSADEPHRGIFFHGGETETTVVDGFTITGGHAELGGGIYCELASPTIRNCVITRNRASDYGGGIRLVGEFYTEIQPNITDCIITDNIAQNAGGGLACDHILPIVDACTIAGNTAAGGGGGVLFSGLFAAPVVASASFTGCVISGNTAGGGGGALLVRPNDRPVSLVLTNTVVVGNDTVNDGGALNVSDTVLSLTHCTIAYNRAAGDEGGALKADRVRFEIVNSVLWGNSPDQINATDDEIQLVSWCDVQDGWEGEGEGNIDADPLLAFEGDAHLQAGSPCIDAGSNPLSLPTDADGNPRPLDGDNIPGARVDMGAYEFNPSAPSIALSGDVKKFYTSELDPSSQTETLALRNAGGGVLEWSVTPTCSWATVTPDSGTSAGEEVEVEIAVDPAGLAPGMHSCTLVVEDLDAVNSPRAIDVTLYFGAIHRVPSVYATIQEAIDATTIDADVVLLADGVYIGTENRDLDFHGKNLTLLSENGPANVIIDCDDSGRGFYFHTQEAAVATVEGITIRNGHATSSSPGGAGGGAIRCTDFSRPTIRNCRIESSVADGSGGGVYCVTGATIVDCVITGNAAAGSGGGLRAFGVVIDGCVVTENSATQGGGIQASIHVTINETTISGNTAQEIGGGLYAISGVPTLTNCVLDGNVAEGSGGGVHGAITATDCVFAGNSAVLDGGGLYSTSNSGDTVLTGCEFSLNSAGGAGGGMFNDGSPSVIDCDFISNSAESGGGMANIDGGKHFVWRCVFRDNQAVNGGGAFNSDAPSDSRFANCRFENNVSTNGGGLYASDGIGKVQNCLFTGNVAAIRGGGVYGGGELVASTFSLNSAGAQGGALLIPAGSPDMDGCILWGNAPDQISADSANPFVSFCDIEGGWEGDGNIDEDPLFVTGPLGDFYLSQLDAGQAQQSPCADAGYPHFWASGTTRTDDAPDEPGADMGFHYFSPLSPTDLPGIVGVWTINEHGAVGPLQESVFLRGLVETNSNGVTTETRIGGINHLELGFDDPLDPSVGGLNAAVLSITPDPGVAVATSLANDNRTLVVHFTPALPNAETYRFRVTDDVIAEDHVTMGDRNFDIRALIGNVFSSQVPPQYVDAIDLGLTVGIRGKFGFDVTGGWAEFDINQDGEINAVDFSCVRLSCGVFGTVAP